MSNRRRGQESAQEIGELRRENERLIRQVARLRRENERLQGLSSEKDDDPVPTTTKAAGARASCPKCGSTNLGQLTIPGGKKVTACRGCREWKTKPA